MEKIGEKLTDTIHRDSLSDVLTSGSKLQSPIMPSVWFYVTVHRRLWFNGYRDL